MSVLAHVTASETPYWIAAVALGLILGIGLSLAFFARSDRDGPR